MAKRDPKFIEKVKQRIDTWFDYWSDNNATYEDSVEFVMGEQWDQQDIPLLRKRNKQAMTFNKLRPILNKILGDQRQNTPDLQVIAIDEDVPPDEIAVMQQFVKSIAFHTDSKVSYQTAFQSALSGGYGVIRVDTGYETPDSFEQCVTILPTLEPTKCFFDPSAREISKRDGHFCGEVVNMSRDEWKRKYPKLKEPDEMALPLTKISWAGSTSIMIVDYFEKEFKNKKILLLENGESVDEKDYIKRKTEGEELVLAMKDGEPMQRDGYEIKIKRYKIGGEYILEETEWACDELPLVFVDQNSHIANGKQITSPFFKDAIDAQRFINFLGTHIAYLIKGARYDQWTGTKEMIAGLEDVWTNPERIQGMLLYKPHIVGNTGAILKPERIQTSEIPQTLLIQYERALRDIQTTLGVYETQLGAQGNESSGIAITERGKRGDASTFVTFDSLNRAISQVGNIVLKLIPNIYDTPRSVVMNTEDSGARSVPINQPVNGYSEERKNDVTKGKYRIHIEAGASFEGQKQESLVSLKEMMQLDPRFPVAFADLFAQNLPLANTREIVNRAKTFVPPELIAAGKGEKVEKQQQQPDPMMMQQMQMQQMQMQMQQHEMQLKEKELALKEKDLQLKAMMAEQDSKVKVAKILGDQYIAEEKLMGTKIEAMAEIEKSHDERLIAKANAITDMHVKHAGVNKMAAETKKLLGELGDG